MRGFWSIFLKYRLPACLHVRILFYNEYRLLKLDPKRYCQKMFFRILFALDAIGIHGSNQNGNIETLLKFGISIMAMDILLLQDHLIVLTFPF